MDTPTLELHYHLRDRSHAMDAFIRNRCEAEALAAFAYLAERLGVDFTIESVAHGEGGLREIWKFACRPEIAWPTFITVLTLILQNAVAVWNAPPKPDQELESINKDIARATLEEKRLAVEKARLELKRLLDGNNTTPPPPPTPTRPPAAVRVPRLPQAGVPSASDLSPAAQSSSVSASEIAFPAGMDWLVPAPRTAVEAVVQALDVIAEEPKFTIRRSNFFKTLLTYDKVTAFGLQYSEPFKRYSERVIEKKDFLKYVLKTNKLAPVIIPEAKVTIVAPVIDGSGMAWKGIYEGEAVSFFMKDSHFKDQVIRREVSFQHGDAILCSFVIERKVDEAGEVVVTSRSVEVVIEKIDEGGVRETQQGKRWRFEQSHAGDQRDLDLDPPEGQ